MELHLQNLLGIDSYGNFTMQLWKAYDDEAELISEVSNYLYYGLDSWGRANVDE